MGDRETGLIAEMVFRLRGVWVSVSIQLVLFRQEEIDTLCQNEGGSTLHGVPEAGPK